MVSRVFFFFFFNDTATTEIYTLALHDALPICTPRLQAVQEPEPLLREGERKILPTLVRSEERFSRNAETDIVCRLLPAKNATDRLDTSGHTGLAPPPPHYHAAARRA